MTEGYATSAQALELIADDYVESYRENARDHRTEARTEALKMVLFGSVTALNVDGITQNLPVWMRAINLLAAGTATALAWQKYDYRKELLLRARGLEQVATDWSERETKHPLLYVSGSEPNATRYLPEELRKGAMPIRPYTNYHQLLQGTDQNKLGLINGVTGQAAGTIEVIEETGANYTLPFGLFIPELKTAIHGLFGDHDRFLLIGHRVEEDFCTHHILPAITSDEYYNNRRNTRVASAEAAKGLLWTPAPART